MTEPKVLISILNYNRRDDLLRCVRSVLELDYRNYDVVVVDNDSSDDSMEMLTHEFGDRVATVRNSLNLGTAGGYNRCIEEAVKREAQYVFLLNNDIVLGKGCLRELVNAASRLSQVGVVGSTVYFLGSDSVWSCGGSINSCLGRTSHIQSEVSEEYLEVDYVPGAAMLISLEVIEGVGNFDEDYFMYWEDADYCTRVRHLGYKNVVASKSATYHRVGCAAGKYTALTTYYPLRNRLLYGKKHIFGWKRFIFGIYSLILFSQKVGAIILGRLFRQRLGPLERMRAVPMAYYDSLRGRYGKRV